MKSPYSFSVLSSGGLSDEGFAHKKNEDAWDIFKLESGAGTITVGMVADGVTSKAGGATASGLATSTIRQVMTEAAATIFDAAALQETIDDAIHKANRAILDEGRKNPEIGNMSTTLVLAAVGWGQLQIAYLGDSRAYLLRDNRLHRLTLDHTWAQEALDKGLIDAEELKTHPNRNVIRRFLGINRQIDIDRQILKPGHYDRSYTERDYTRSLTLHQKDLLMLCSDGLTERSDDDELAAILSKRADQPQRAVGELVQLALTRQEQDNITAVVLSLAEERKGSSLIKMLGWSAALVALLVAGVFGYLFSRTSSPTLLASPAITSQAQSTTIADSGPAEQDALKVAGASAADNPSETSDADQPAVKLGVQDASSGSNGQPANDAADTDSEPPSTAKAVGNSLNANTIPFAETRAAQEAEERATALAQSTEEAVTVEAVRIEPATVEPTSTPMATADPQRIASAAQTATQNDGEPLRVGALESDSQEEERIATLGSTVGNTVGSTVARNLELATSTSSLGDQGATELPDESEPERPLSSAQSTPTRKAQPTAKPTSTPTKIPTARPTLVQPSDSAASTLPANGTGTDSALTDPDALAGGNGSQGAASSGVTDNSTTADDGTGQEGPQGEEFIFVLPPDQESIQAGRAVPFQWITDYQLGENQTFEVVVWQPTSANKVALEHGMGMVDIVHSPPTKIDATTWKIDAAPPRNFDAGEYKWAVLVVETEPDYKRVMQLGTETRNFILTKESSGVRSSGKTEDSSGESSGGCSGPSCGDR